MVPISCAILSMDEQIPKTARLWRLSGWTGLDCLKFSEEPVPELGDHEVLVQSKPPSVAWNPFDQFVSLTANEYPQSVAYRSM